MGNDVEAKAGAPIGIIRHTVHRERHAIQRHRPLGGDERRNCRANCHHNTVGIPFRGDGGHGANAIDMARHNMAAQFIANFQRTFQIEPTILRPHAARRFGNSFRRCIHGKPIRPLINNRQADARTRNGSPQIHARHVIAALDDQPQVAALFNCCDRANIRDYAGKHDCRPFSNALVNVQLVFAKQAAVRQLPLVLRIRQPT